MAQDDFNAAANISSGHKVVGEHDVVVVGEPLPLLVARIRMHLEIASRHAKIGMSLLDELHERIKKIEAPPLPDVEIVLEIEGGVLQNIEGSVPFRLLRVDWDNIMEGPVFKGSTLDDENGYSVPATSREDLEAFKDRMREKYNGLVETYGRNDDR